MDVQEVRKLDAYLKKLFGNARIRVVPQPRKDDLAEVFIGEERLGDSTSTTKTTTAPTISAWKSIWDR